jgi:hypothetical protein
MGSQIVPYAYVCVPCGHLLHRHGLMPLAPSVVGPYRCRDCKCEITQGSPSRGVSRLEYQDLFTSTGMPRKGVDHAV